MAEYIADIFSLNNRAQKELMEYVSSKQVLETIALNFDIYGETIKKAVLKLFSDDSIKYKYSKIEKLFRPMSLIRIQREVKMFLENKRDEFNKEEIKNMLYTYAIVLLFLIIRDQNEFYKEYIERLSKKVDNINKKFPAFLQDSNKIYAPILLTIDEMGPDLSPEVKCFYHIEEKISKMS